MQNWQWFKEKNAVKFVCHNVNRQQISRKYGKQTNLVIEKGASDYYETFLNQDKLKNFV